VTVKNPDVSILGKMYQIAASLDAKVQGDDGEVYGPSGEPEAAPLSLACATEAVVEALGVTADRSSRP
jgi:hypothetical protein